MGNVLIQSNVECVSMTVVSCSSFSFFILYHLLKITTFEQYKFTLKCLSIKKSLESTQVAQRSLLLVSISSYLESCRPDVDTHSPFCCGFPWLWRNFFFFYEKGQLEEIPRDIHKEMHELSQGSAESLPPQYLDLIYLKEVYY